MKRRCLHTNNPSFKNYGGRGIRVCKRWFKFENFFADMGHKPDNKMTLERIDNDGNYEPSNCKWAPRAENNRNTRRQKNDLCGICFVKSRKKYLVRIDQKHIGIFKTLKEAVIARKKAEQKYWGK